MLKIQMGNNFCSNIWFGNKLGTLVLYEVYILYQNTYYVNGDAGW